jgi:hypothetical protein
LKQEKTHVLVKNSRASPEIDVALLQVVVVVVVVGHFEKHALQRRLATPLVAFGAQI